MFALHSDELEVHLRSPRITEQWKLTSPVYWLMMYYFSHNPECQMWVIYILNCLSFVSFICKWKHCTQCHCPSNITPPTCFKQVMVSLIVHTQTQKTMLRSKSPRHNIAADICTFKRARWSQNRLLRIHFVVTIRHLRAQTDLCSYIFTENAFSLRKVRSVTCERW